MHWPYTKREVTLYVTHSSSGAFSGATKCAVNGYTFCRLQVTLRVHILSPATNCAGATKCAVKPRPSSASGVRNIRHPNLLQADEHVAPTVGEA